MNHSHHSCAAALTAPALAQRRQAAAPSLFVRLLDTLAAWQHRSRSRRDLAALDEHLLRDIGLTRAQVETETGKPFWRA